MVNSLSARHWVGDDEWFEKVRPRPEPAATAASANHLDLDVEASCGVRVLKFVAITLLLLKNWVAASLLNRALDLRILLSLCDQEVKSAMNDALEFGDSVLKGDKLVAAVEWHPPHAIL